MENTTSHFSKEALLHLAVGKGQNVTEIIHYEWLNQVNPKAAYTFVDKIEFRFKTGKTLILAINEEDSGIEIMSKYDFEAEKSAVSNEFDGKISLTKHTAHLSMIWVAAVKSVLMDIETEASDEGQSNTHLFFNFGEEKRVIFHHPERGLVTEIYEDDI